MTTLLVDADVARFEAKIDGPSGDRDCREWNAGTNEWGYGVVRFGGRIELAHRVAFFIANGYWPEVCCHDCDNPPCCEPSHLLDGTNADNSRDAVERGRARNSSIRAELCHKGHPKAWSGGRWRCPECRRDSAKRRYEAKKTGAPPVRPAERTHCPAGHPYDEANTRIYRGKRYCKECSRARVRAHRASKRAA